MRRNLSGVCIMQLVSVEEAPDSFDSLEQSVINGDEIVITCGAAGVVKMTSLKPVGRQR